MFMLARFLERFAWFGALGVLAYFATQQLQFLDAQVQTHYAVIAPLSFLIPLALGLFGLGRTNIRLAIAFAGLLLVGGYCLLAAATQPARTFLVFEGTRYEIVTEGRMDQRSSPRIEVNGARYDFRPATSVGGIEIEHLPPEATLPSNLPAGSFTFTTARSAGSVSIYLLVLALIIVGASLFRTSASTIVATSHGGAEPSASRALFQAGATKAFEAIVNGVAFSASIACAYLATVAGWWAAFAVAAISTLLACVILSQRAITAPPVKANSPLENRQAHNTLAGPILFCVVSIIGVWLLLQSDISVDWPRITAIASIGVCIVYLVQRSRKRWIAVFSFVAIAAISAMIGAWTPLVAQLSDRLAPIYSNVVNIAGMQLSNVAFATLLTPLGFAVASLLTGRIFTAALTLSFAAASLWLLVFGTAIASQFMAVEGNIGQEVIHTIIVFVALDIGLLPVLAAIVERPASVSN